MQRLTINLSKFGNSKTRLEQNKALREKIYTKSLETISFIIYMIFLFYLIFSSLSKCQYFENSFDLPPGIEFILVQCKGSHSKDTDKKKAKTVYSNAHAIVRRKPQMVKIFDSFKTLYPTEKPISILMLGIDSISRLNLIRAMPNTAQLLYDTGWFELKGYNKVKLFDAIFTTC